MQFKKLIFFIISATIFLTGCNSKEDGNKNEPKKELIKQKNTNYQLTTTDSTIINLDIKENFLAVEEIKEKVILLNFFATWCPPCKAEIPHLVNLKNKYKDKFEIIAINVGDKNGHVSDLEVLKTFINDYGINYIVTLGDNNLKVADAMGGVRTIPTMFLFDSKGKIVQKYVGIVPEEMMETDIKKALGI